MKTNAQTTLLVASLQPIASHNYTLEERARYQPETISPDELVDLMAELEAWRDAGVGHPQLYTAFDTPEELVNVLEALEEETRSKGSELETLYDERDKLQDEVDDYKQSTSDRLDHIETLAKLLKRTLFVVETMAHARGMEAQLMPLIDDINEALNISEDI